MKTRLLIAFTTLVLATSALAQGGAISLYADPSGTNCHLSDTTPGLCNVFIVHIISPGVTASEFGVNAPGCLQATFLAYTPNFAVDIAFDVANPLLGRSVGYGACLVSPVHIATIGYFCLGLTPPCCVQSIGQHAGTGGARAVDCASNLLAASCGSAFWNPNATCSCLIHHGPEPSLGSACNPVATFSSTWGRVKAIFAD